MGYLGYKPADKPLTSADITDSIITSAKIVDDTIANADIANSTINLTTKVTGTLPLTNGGTGLATLGTAAQELRVNSGATALEYYTPTVASSDFVLLATSTASSSASISFNGYFSSTYSNYQIHFYNLDFSLGVDFFFRIRVSNADITTSTYRYAVHAAPRVESTGAITVDGTRATWTTASSGLLNSNNPGTATGDYVSQGIMYVQNPLSTTSAKIFMGEHTYLETGTAGITRSNYWIANTGTSALSGVTFYPSSGTIVTGTFKLYGIK
jgi:hypothetical protein